MQRVVEMSTEFICSPSQGGPKVRPSHIADEERVTCEHSKRIDITLCQIEHKNRNRLERMARRMHNFDTHAGECKNVPIFHRQKCVLSFSARTQMNRCSACISQLKMACQKICMKMR